LARRAVPWLARLSGTGERQRCGSEYQSLSIRHLTVDERQGKMMRDARCYREGSLTQARGFHNSGHREPALPKQSTVEGGHRIASCGPGVLPDQVVGEITFALLESGECADEFVRVGKGELGQPVAKVEAQGIANTFRHRDLTFTCKGCAGHSLLLSNILTSWKGCLLEAQEPHLLNVAYWPDCCELGQ